MSDDPFRLLGLPRQPGLSDDDVRAAWRRIAAATHPDRDDGGDPAFFGAAAAAYATLRTAYGRGEALADLSDRADRAGPAAGRRHGGQHRARERPGSSRWPGGWRWPGQGGGHPAAGARGRPGVLALRAAGASVVCAGTFAIAGWAPATVGVVAGSLTWLFATGRHDFS
jgi:curved DNA-binding protein CbpA